MTILVVASADFDAVWPFATEHWHRRWHAEGEAGLFRVSRDDRRPLGQVAPEGAGVTRLAALGVPVTQDCLESYPDLREVAIVGALRPTLSRDAEERLRAEAVEVYRHHSEGFWSESVAEFALALTICALRGIPQQHRSMIEGLQVWQRYRFPPAEGRVGAEAMYSDDSRFANGTIAGKRIRIVGAGNIGSRFAHYTSMMGADVAVWDPLAPDPSFHRAGARKVWRLDDLVGDAEIFAPMLPLTEQTRGIVTAEHIRSLPDGCLVVLVTRAGICDMAELRRRVLADELALAADVFDIEPVPLEDPLLGRSNVVHTPHVAGRTRDANIEWVEMLLAQFRTT